MTEEEIRKDQQRRDYLLAESMRAKGWDFDKFLTLWAVKLQEDMTQEQKSL